MGCSDIILECSIMFFVDNLDTSKFIVAILVECVLRLKLLPSGLLLFASSVVSLGILSNFTEHGIKEVFSDGTEGVSHTGLASLLSALISGDIFSNLSSLASDFIVEEEDDATGEHSSSVSEGLTS